MSDQIITIVQYDRKPLLLRYFKSAGVTLTLYSADVTQVYFRMVEMRTQELRRLGECCITDQTNGQVQWRWLAGDTCVPGVYSVEWIIAYTNGTTLAVREPEWIVVRDQGA